MQTGPALAREMVLPPSLFEPNPFAAERIRPGALPFLFPAGVTPATLWELFRQAHYRGQIVGAHGSGKTTLVKTLAHSSPWKDSLSAVFLLRTNDRPDEFADLPGPLWRPNRLWMNISRLPAGSLAMVDGFDLIGFAARLLCRMVVKLRRLKFLVTTHRPCRLPILIHLEPNAELARQIARQCLSRAAEWRLTHGLAPVDISDELIDQVFLRSQGNIREMLFQLYDVYESLTRGGTTLRPAGKAW